MAGVPVFMRRILLTLTIASAFIGMNAPASAETITLVADEWCPYTCKPDSDKPGLFIEIAKKVFAREGIDVTYKTIPWARAIEETRAGKYTSIAGASIGDARDFIFPTEPQAQSVMTFYVKYGSRWTYQNLASLDKISLGTIVDYSYSNLIDSYIAKNKDNMRLVQQVGGNNALESNVLKVIKKRVGATIESAAVMEYYLATQGRTGQLIAAGAMPVNDDQNLYIAFSPKDPNAKRYARIVTDGTRALRQSGKIQEILNRYSLTEEKVSR